MGISTKKSSRTSKPVYDKQITGAYDTLSGTYNQQAPKIAGVADSLTGMLPEMQQRWRDGNPAVNAATDYVTSTLGSDGTNPHLEGWIADQQNQTQNMLGARLNKLGLGPAGTTHQGLSARENARVGLGMRYDDWNQGQQRKAQAAGMAPGIAAGEAIGVAPMLATAELGAGLPMNAASQFAAGTGGLLGQYTQDKYRDSPSTASQIGKGLKIGAQLFSMFSDERLKTDIREVGKTEGGLPIYTYRYKGDNTPQMGVMAQDVEKKQPKALGPVLGGYKTVQYSEVR